MEFQFRKATFGGFQRQDVVDYLEKISKDHAAQLEEMEGKIAQLEEVSTKLAQLEEQQEALIQENAKAQQEVESLQAKLKGAQGENATLTQANQEMQEKIFALTPDAEAYRSVKERAAGMELDAHVRAQKTIDEAKSQAKAIREDSRQWMGQMKSQFATNRGELDLAVAHGLEAMKTAQKNLDTLSQSMAQRDRALEQLVAEWHKKLDKK